MKKSKINIIITTILSIFFLLMQFKLEDVNASEYKEGYYIKNLHVDIEVTQEKNYLVTEYIDIHFNQPVKEVARKIPLKLSSNKYTIDNISVDGYEYMIYDKTSYVELKIKNEDSINGDNKYVLKYTLKDDINNKGFEDSVYLNILGSSLDVPTIVYTSTIKYPIELKQSNISLKGGQKDTKIKEYIDYKTNKNIIDIYSKRIIPSNKTFNIDIKFKEKPFKAIVNNSNNSNNINYIYYIKIVRLISLFFIILIVVLIFNSRKRIKLLSNELEFYPPEDMNSICIGYLYSGVITSEMIVSYIYEWCNEGYIKIAYSKDDEPILIRQKSLSKGNDFEKELFDTIFHYGMGTPKKVMAKHLRYKLGDIFKNISSKIKEKYNKHSEYKKMESRLSCIIRKISAFLIIANILYFEYVELGAKKEILILICIATFILFYKMFQRFKFITYDFNESFSKNLNTKYDIKIVFVEILVFYLILYIVGLNMEILDLILYTMPLFIVIIATPMIVSKKTSYEEVVYSKICGLRKFIKKSNVEKLEELVLNDEDYFYKILPYAQSLGVADIWTYKFQYIKIKSSDNYSSEIDMRDLRKKLEEVIVNADNMENTRRFNKRRFF